jgi:predicted HAD superfamily Cof-like phosphohydrolase
MRNYLDKVREFYKSFKQDEFIKDSKVNVKRSALRYELMKEENEEYLDANIHRDEVEIADALGDMLYILCGTIIEHGMEDKIEEVFNEIHRSNMSKLGEDGNPIYREDGKITKGPNYFKPNISLILNK